MPGKRNRNASITSPDNAEQQRLVIALGIIAAAIGVFAIPNHKPTGWLIVQAAITIQAALAFLYILFTASALKYKGSGSLFDINPSEKLRQWFYDQSIEMFWATLYSGTASLLLVTTSAKFVPYLLLGGFGLVLLFMIVMMLRKRKSTKLVNH